MDFEPKINGKHHTHDARIRKKNEKCFEQKRIKSYKFLLFIVVLCHRGPFTEAVDTEMRLKERDGIG